MSWTFDVYWGGFLGAGESGKSTFIKQMRIVHGDDFSEDETVRFKELIHHNILDSIQNVLRAMTNLNFDYEKPENLVSISEDWTRESNSRYFEFQKNAELISQINDLNEFMIEEQHCKALGELWEDAGVQQCMKRGNKYNLLDSTE